MFDYYTSSLHVESHRAHLLQAAQRQRLAALSDAPQRPSYNHVFVAIGSFLISLGSRLRRRYAVSGSEHPAPRTV